VSAPDAIVALAGEARRLIAARVDAAHGRDDVLAGLDAALASNAVTPPPPRELAACRHLEPALANARAAGLGGIVNAIEQARPHLHWITSDLYPPEDIGPRFARSHAFAEIIGPGAAIAAADYALGLFIIGPQVLYRDRHHPAPELYLPLTGPTRWRFGAGAPWETRAAGQPVWNPANHVHATIVDAVPFLCLYAWTRDVREPSAVDIAPDWAELDRTLAQAGAAL
jgi:hypothetical protein